MAGQNMVHFFAIAAQAMRRILVDHARHGDPGGRRAGNSSAAAVLSYDVAHKAPWGWQVSLYTLVAALLVLFGLLDAASSLWLWTALSSPASSCMSAVYLAAFLKKLIRLSRGSPEPLAATAGRPTSSLTR